MVPDPLQSLGVFEKKFTQRFLDNLRDSIVRSDSNNTSSNSSESLLEDLNEPLVRATEFLFPVWLDLVLGTDSTDTFAGGLTENVDGLGKRRGEWKRSDSEPLASSSHLSPDLPLDPKVVTTMDWIRHQAHSNGCPTLSSSRDCFASAPFTGMPSTPPLDELSSDGGFLLGSGITKLWRRVRLPLLDVLRNSSSAYGRQSGRGQNVSQRSSTLFPSSTMRSTPNPFAYDGEDVRSNEEVNLILHSFGLYAIESSSSPLLGTAVRSLAKLTPLFLFAGCLLTVWYCLQNRQPDAVAVKKEPLSSSPPSSSHTEGSLPLPFSSSSSLSECSKKAGKIEKETTTEKGDELHPASQAGTDVWQSEKVFIQELLNQFDEKCKECLVLHYKSGVAVDCTLRKLSTPSVLDEQEKKSEGHFAFSGEDFAHRLSPMYRRKIYTPISGITRNAIKTKKSTLQNRESRGSSSLFSVERGNEETEVYGEENAQRSPDISRTLEEGGEEISAYGMIAAGAFFDACLSSYSARVVEVGVGSGKSGASTFLSRKPENFSSEHNRGTVPLENRISYAMLAGILHSYVKRLAVEMDRLSEAIQEEQKGANPLVDTSTTQTMKYERNASSGQRRSRFSSQGTSGADVSSPFAAPLRVGYLMGIALQSPVSSCVQPAGEAADHGDRKRGRHESSSLWSYKKSKLRKNTSVTHFSRSSKAKKTVGRRKKRPWGLSGKESEEDEEESSSDEESDNFSDVVDFDTAMEEREEKEAYEVHEGKNGCKKSVFRQASSVSFSSNSAQQRTQHLLQTLLQSHSVVFASSVLSLYSIPSSECCADFSNGDLFSVLSFTETQLRTGSLEYCTIGDDTVDL